MSRKPSRTIRLQTFLRVSPLEAFRAISEPNRLKGWLLDSAQLPLRSGGRYRFGWTGGPQHTGRVIRVAPGKSYTLSWQWPGREDQLMTRLKISVERRRGGSIVRFVHSGFPKEERWVDLYAGAVQGWTYFLMNLKSVLVHGHDLRSELDW